MTIAEKLQKISDIKADIKTAINDKGVEVTDSTPFEEYPNKIAQISSGSEKTNTFWIFGKETYDGHIDEQGLRDIGWTEEDIAYFRDNGGLAHNSDEDQNFIVDQVAKNMYANAQNYNSFEELFLSQWRYDEDEGWIPVVPEEELYGNIKFMPKLPYPIPVEFTFDPGEAASHSFNNVIAIPNSNSILVNASDAKFGWMTSIDWTISIHTTVCIPILDMIMAENINKFDLSDFFNAYGQWINDYETYNRTYKLKCFNCNVIEGTLD